MNEGKNNNYDTCICSFVNLVIAKHKKCEYVEQYSHT